MRVSTDYNICFYVPHELGSEPTPAMMREALLARITNLGSSGEWFEACEQMETIEEFEDGEDDQT